MVCTKRTGSEANGLEESYIPPINTEDIAGDCGERLLTPMDTETASDGEECPSSGCIGSGEFCYGRGTPPRIQTIQDRPGIFGNNKSVKHGDNDANQAGDGPTETQPGAVKLGTKRAAKGKKGGI